MPRKIWTQEERRHLSETMKEKYQQKLAEAEAAKAEMEGFEEMPEVPEEFEPPSLAEGGVPVVETEAEAISVVEPQTDFDRFVLALDSETRELLDENDLYQIFSEQQAKAKAERRAQVKKRATDKALLAARIAEGVVPAASATDIAWAEYMDEEVDFTVEMPTCGGIPQPGVTLGPVDIGLRINGKIYLDGHRYTVKRSQYLSYRDIIYRAQQNELAFEGRGRDHYLRRQALGSVERRIN